MTYEWHHFELGDPKLGAFLDANVPHIAAAALTQPETRPRCDRLGDGVILNLRGVNMNEGQEVDDMVSLRLWVTSGMVVTVRVRRIFALDDIRRKIADGAGPDTVGEFLTALVTGLRDYVYKNGFRDVVIGLSGGIDSALTAAIAVDALGPGSVWGVTMPTRFSSEGSVNHSVDLANNLGCRIDEIPIEDIFGEFLEALVPVFAGTEFGVAEENLQARIRGAIIMAISNKFGGMVVATGNKSEMAVGYATLYGDMAGGYAVLKDVFKTRVYKLSEWRNRDGEVIPRAIIDKPPSAELRPDQKDTDSLPEYDLLDEILRRYIEWDESPAVIIEEGFDRDTVLRVARMVDRNEYKRRQAAPGVRITKKAFGKDRRLPITNRFKD